MPRWRREGAVAEGTDTDDGRTKRTARGRARRAEVDGELARDAEYFDERAEQFRCVQRELEERACVSPAPGETPTGSSGGAGKTLGSPAAYGTIDDVGVVDAADLPEWYLERVARGETLPQGLEGQTLEDAPADAGTDEPLELIDADEYLRLDVLVDEETWDTYVPVPRSAAEYESSALATLRDRLDGRPIERFHCARMPIRYECGRYVPDYGSRTYGRWLREQGFVRWTDESGYELKPGLRAPAFAAGVVGVLAGGAVAGSVSLAFFFLSILELLLVGLWIVLPITYLSSVLIARHVFKSTFKRFGLIHKRRARAAAER